MRGQPGKSNSGKADGWDTIDNSQLSCYPNSQVTSWERSSQDIWGDWILKLLHFCLASGLCPPVGSTLPPDQWLQGYPTSQQLVCNNSPKRSKKDEHAPHCATFNTCIITVCALEIFGGWVKQSCNRMSKGSGSWPVKAPLRCLNRVRMTITATLGQS